MPGLPTRTCVGTFPRWEPRWQYLVKITNTQVGITFIIPKLTYEVNHMPEEINGLSDKVLSHLIPNGEEFPRMRE